MKDTNHVIYKLVRKARGLIMRLADELANNEMHCARYGYMANYVFAMIPVSGINQPMDDRELEDQIVRWNTFVLMCKPLLDLNKQFETVLERDPLSDTARRLIREIDQELGKIDEVTEQMLDDLSNGQMPHVVID
jgi:hypothetical protein